MAEQLEIEDFDTAKAVFEKLKDVPAERRKRLSFDALRVFEKNDDLFHLRFA